MIVDVSVQITQTPLSCTLSLPGPAVRLLDPPRSTIPVLFRARPLQRRRSCPDVPTTQIRPGPAPERERVSCCRMRSLLEVYEEARDEDRREAIVRRLHEHRQEVHTPVRPGSERLLQEPSRYVPSGQSRWRQRKERGTGCTHLEENDGEIQHVQGREYAGRARLRRRNRSTCILRNVYSHEVDRACADGHIRALAMVAGTHEDGD